MQIKPGVPLGFERVQTGNVSRFESVLGFSAVQPFFGLGQGV